MNRIGIDIGGSGLRAAVVRDGVVSSEVYRRRWDSRSVDEVVRSVAEVHARMGGGAVGIGMPGFVSDDGVVIASPNFPEWREVEFESVLQGETGEPVRVVNDATAAAYGLYRQESDAKRLVLFTLGTGVGGGIVLDGRPLLGPGTEVGHIYAGGDRLCGCGRRGCLETWAGTVGLRAAAAEHGRRVDSGEDVVMAARSGESWAQDVVERAAFHLGKVAGMLVNTLAPDVIAVGGGLSGAHGLFASAEDVMRQSAIPALADAVRWRWVGPVDEVAILGAAELVGR